MSWETIITMSGGAAVVILAYILFMWLREYWKLRKTIRIARLVHEMYGAEGWFARLRREVRDEIPDYVFHALAHTKKEHEAELKRLRGEDDVIAG